MNITPLEIEDVIMLTPNRYQDERGFFSETYNKKCLQGHGLDITFIQDNHSYSVVKGTIRGLHYQLPPYGQDKLIRVIHGSIYDVAVDIREGSKTFGKYVAATLSADAGNQLFVPQGFAHGFITLEANTHVEYKVSNYYRKDHERGICWNDEELNIAWPCDAEDITLNDRDALFTSLAEATDLFTITTH